MLHTKHTSHLYPDFVANSVVDITIPKLQEVGIKHLVFDIDETLVPMRHTILSPEYISHIKAIQKAGIKVYIGSNATRDLSSISEPIGATIIHPTRFKFKPRKKYFDLILKETGASKNQVAMVGDRIVNDIIGANRAGFTTIMVMPYERTPRIVHKTYVKRALKKTMQ